METNFNRFVENMAEPKQPLTIRSNNNPDFYITISFDDKGRVVNIINRWDVKLPNWTGLTLSEKELKNWLADHRPEMYIEPQSV